MTRLVVNYVDMVHNTSDCTISLDKALPNVYSYETTVDSPVSDLSEHIVLHHAYPLSKQRLIFLRVMQLEASKKLAQDAFTAKVHDLLTAHVRRQEPFQQALAHLQVEYPTISAADLDVALLERTIVVRAGAEVPLADYILSVASPLVPLEMASARASTPTLSDAKVSPAPVSLPESVRVPGVPALALRYLEVERRRAEWRCGLTLRALSEVGGWRGTWRGLGFDGAWVSECEVWICVKGPCSGTFGVAAESPAVEEGDTEWVAEGGFEEPTGGGDEGACARAEVDSLLACLSMHTPEHTYDVQRDGAAVSMSAVDAGVSRYLLPSLAADVPTGTKAYSTSTGYDGYEDGFLAGVKSTGFGSSQVDLSHYFVNKYQ